MKKADEGGWMPQKPAEQTLADFLRDRRRDGATEYWLHPFDIFELEGERDYESFPLADMPEAIADLGGLMLCADPNLKRMSWEKVPKRRHRRK